MDRILFLFTAIIITFFGMWPVFGTKSGFPVSWLMIFIGLFTFLSGFIALYVLPEQSLAHRDVRIPMNEAIKFFVLAVFFNCAGNFLFSNILASRSEMIPLHVMIIMAGVPVSAQIAQIHFGFAKFTSLTIPAMIFVILGICMLTIKQEQIIYFTNTLKKIF